MFIKYQPTQEYPSVPQNVPRLNYDKPELGKNYWILDNALENAEAVSKRCFNSKKWKLGYPYTQEKWPGKRANKALKTKELEKLEDWVKLSTGASRLWIPDIEGSTKVDSNVAQKIAKGESTPLPHTDSRNLCRYAAVIYLSPKPDPQAGTAFYRMRYPNGAPGGNIVSDPYINLRDALKIKTLPPQAWFEELRVENVFNRLLLYKANMVHSATGYFGVKKRDKRLTALFFWMAE